MSHLHSCQERSLLRVEKARPMTVQSHSYSERPFGAWDTTSEEPVADERANAVARLMRPTVGASSAQAQVLADEIGPDQIRSMSDTDLAVKVANPEGVVHNPDQAVIAEILAEVGDDPLKAQVALDAERAGKARSTLISALEAIVSTPAQEPVPDGESADGGHAGVEPETVQPLADATPAPGDPGAPEVTADGQPNTA